MNAVLFLGVGWAALGASAFACYAGARKLSDILAALAVAAFIVSVLIT